MASSPGQFSTIESVNILAQYVMYILLGEHSMMRFCPHVTHVVSIEPKNSFTAGWVVFQSVLNPIFC